MNEQLRRMYSAVEFLANIESQDRTLTLEMSQQMLLDIMENGELRPMVEYIKRFCDVIDSADDAEEMARLI
jgi:hypothetical protein